MHGEGDGRRESPVPTSTILLAVDGGRRGPQSTAFCASATRTGEGNRRAGGRRSGGFGGKRTAARPGSSSRREKKDPSFTTSRADILSGLKVDLSSAAAPAARPSAPAAAPSHGRRRGPAPAVPKARPGSRDGLSSDFVMARPVTPELNTTAGIGYRARGGGAAFPTRKAWHTNLPRASSADGGSRRSSRMEPDSPIYIRSLDWEPTRHAPEPEPGPPACVAPTGRVFQAECTEKQRERDLAAIHAKYSGSNAMEAAAAATAEEEPQALLCPKHRAEQDPKEAEAAPNSRTQSVSFLFCGDCFAVQAAQKQQQAEDERKAQVRTQASPPHLWFRDLSEKVLVITAGCRGCRSDSTGGGAEIWQVNRWTDAWRRRRSRPAAEQNK